MSKERANKVASIQPLLGRVTLKSLSEDEVKASMEATRRGVKLSEIEKALDIPIGGLQQRIGKWALYHCQCFAKVKS